MHSMEEIRRKKLQKKYEAELHLLELKMKTEELKHELTGFNLGMNLADYGLTFAKKFFAKGLFSK